MPFVALKYAMTIDGKIASHTGDSKWVTGEKTREHVHYLRKKYSSIMVGINTVIADNPMLNCRIEEGVNPVRVILDTNLVIPIDSDIVQTAGDIRTIVAFNGEAAEKKNGKDYENYIAKKSKLKNMGVELADIRCGSRVDIKALLKKLGEMNIDSVLVEGGGEVNASVLETGLVNKVYAYIAPKIIMGREAKTPIQGRGIDMMKDAVRLKDISISPMGEEDILLEGYVM